VEPLLRDLAELLDIASVGGTPGEQQAQQWVADKLTAWGWDVDVWVDDPNVHCTQPDYPGMEVERSTVTGVIGKPAASKGNRLILGHTDVVPGGPPPKLTQDHIVGRGAVDMKSGLLAGMYAGREAGGDVAICAVSGEEDGGVGTFLALKHGLRAKACVIPEPTSLAIIPANAGSLTFRITLTGVSAHGARRWDGHNALDGLPQVLGTLQALEAERNAEVPDILAPWPLAYPISIGRIEGGDWPSTVMGQLSIEGRYGVRLDETIPEAMNAFERALPGAAVEWFGGRFAPGSTDTSHPLVRQLEAAHRAVTGTPARVFGATYGSDLRQLVAAGIPTVQHGPGDAALAHSDDEEVSVEEVMACRDVLTAWLRSDT
jgi:acetylornithine deacetylase